MPIDTDSEAWENGAMVDPVEVSISDFLTNNSDSAFSLEEIDEHILQDSPEPVPNSLLPDGSDTGEPEAARRAYLLIALERLIWQSRVTFRQVQDASDDGEEEIYYTTSDRQTFWPIAELDKIGGSIKERIEQTEDEFDDELSDLEDRLSRLEYRVQQELRR